ncbi:hypothetical protein IPM62_05630 [Candidatus Woesebacteria bacterium]|nr:MAG: hypothetical protein IPM62_05630 [Candidatus Woesebacteria bacterium]
MIKFYSVQIRESVEVPESAVEVVTMKNGKLAAKAVTTKDGKELKLFKILSKEDAERLKK